MTPKKLPKKTTQQVIKQAITEAHDEIQEQMRFYTDEIISKILEQPKIVQPASRYSLSIIARLIGLSFLITTAVLLLLKYGAKVC